MIAASLAVRQLKEGHSFCEAHQAKRRFCAAFIRSVDRPVVCAPVGVGYEHVVYTLTLKLTVTSSDLAGLAKVELEAYPVTK